MSKDDSSVTLSEGTDSCQSFQGADDSHGTVSKDVESGLKDWQVSLELRKRALAQLLKWHTELLAARLDDVQEWERVDVDTWAEATGYN